LSEWQPRQSEFSWATAGEARARRKSARRLEVPMRDHRKAGKEAKNLCTFTSRAGTRRSSLDARMIAADPAAGNR